MYSWLHAVNFDILLLGLKSIREEGGILGINI